MLPTSIPRGNIEGCISNIYCDVLRYYRALPNLKVVPSTRGVSSQQACSVILAPQMQVEPNPELIKTRIKAGLGLG